jgi:hypothetical protein
VTTFEPIHVKLKSDEVESLSCLGRKQLKGDFTVAFYVSPLPNSKALHPGGQMSFHPLHALGITTT